MREILQQFINASILSALINLAVGLMLSLLLRAHYVRFGTSLSNRREFGRIFPLLALTVIVVITVVKTSLALSLGLIGALSIVRFRTPIKEPEELAYLFIAIAIGIGLGADQLAYTVSATAFILLVLSGMSAFRSRGQRPQNLYLSLRSKEDASEVSIQTVSKAVAARFSTCDLRRVDLSDPGVTISFYVESADGTQLMQFVDSFKETYPQFDLTIIEQQRVPGV